MGSLLFEIVGLRIVVIAFLPTPWWTMFLPDAGNGDSKNDAICGTCNVQETVYPDSFGIRRDNEIIVVS